MTTRHDLYTDEYGDIDVWRLCYDDHNGPQCSRCLKSWCQHCDPDCFEEECLAEDPATAVVSTN